MAAVLATVAGGSSLVATPGFDAFRFFPWFDAHQPTWYTAVPTMHQLILERAARHTDVIARRPLRFIRSSSAGLPPSVFADLERTFGAPVVEAYGMTEASHQMSSNPLHGERRAGTVGRPAGAELRILDVDGREVPQGSLGEVAIQGPGVTAGYVANPEANASAFSDGWFRTGDQGSIDADGYLTLTGRLKELINRGGEKVAPLEVDDVLLQHPAVAQAVTFARPHDRLGEDVAAAVVLVPGASVEPSELRAFASERLAAFKVPRTLLLVDEIPKGPTGKLQRIGLAARLGLS
jgi:acyl-CoA synthetase (AMP-forming)/AMP-acid ligase II